MDQPATICLSTPQFASTPYTVVEGRHRSRKVHNGISTSSVQLSNGRSDGRDSACANGSYTQSPQVDTMSRSERLPTGHRFSVNAEKLSASRSSQSQLVSELDQSRSFWSAVKEDYEFVMGEHLVDDYRETSFDVREREATEKLNSLMDLFSENCSRLHHDICDAIRDIDDLDQDGFDKLYFQYNQVRKQTALLAEKFPVLGEEVANRLLVVDRIFAQMEGKYLSRHENAFLAGGDGTQSGLIQLRKWLQSSETKLSAVDQQNGDWMFDLMELTKALETVQEIHEEIKRDGGSLVNSLERQLKDCGSDPHARPVVQFQGLERRWHALFLLSLEWQYWLEEQIVQVKSGNFATLGSDSEDEPNKKKRRLSDEFQSSESEEDLHQLDQRNAYGGKFISCPRGSRNGLSESQQSDEGSYISDTLPFPDREYEKIRSTSHSREFIVIDSESEEEMDFNGNDVVDSSGSTVKTPTWGQQSNDFEESPRVDICQKLKNSPSKVYYQTALCDVEGCVNAGNHCGEHSGVNTVTTTATTTCTTTSASLSWSRAIDSEIRCDSSKAEEDVSHLSTSQQQQQRRSEYMTDSMTVNVDEQSDFDLNISQDYQEVLEELGNQEGWDALSAQLQQMAEGKGTTWRTFSGSKNRLATGGCAYGFVGKSLETIPSVPETPRTIAEQQANDNSLMSREMEAPVYSSCDASGEMSNEDETERSDVELNESSRGELPQPVIDPVTPTSRNGSLKRRRRRRMERPLSLSGQRILTSLLSAEPLMTASFHEGRQARHSVFQSEYSNSRRLLDGSCDIWEFSHPMSRSMNTCSSATGSHVWGVEEGLATPTPSLENIILTSSGYGEDFPVLQSENCSPVRQTRMTSSVTLPAGMKYVCEDSPKHLNTSRPNLKAHRRMTRSMSGCDHFLRRTRDLFTSISSLNNRRKTSGLQRSSEPVSAEVPFNTPAASTHQLPTVSLASDMDCCGRVATVDRTESPNIHSDSVCSPLPERLRGDGGSITGPEQSEGIWEWDDYKPPEHNECGLADKALDGTKLIDFGDDYRQFLSSQSDSNSFGFKLKLNSDKLDNRSPLRYKRLQPIGTSQDSDSELEELHRIVKESRVQLKMVQREITEPDCQSPDISNGDSSPFPVLLKICERNIQVLQTVLPDCGKINGEIPEYVALAGLLADWEIQLSEVVRHPTISRVVVGCEADPQDKTPVASADPMSVWKIRSEISCLKDTLEEVTLGGKKYWEISTETDLNEAIQFFSNSVHLLSERKQLIPQLIEYNDSRPETGESDMSREEIKEDLVGCQVLYEEAVKRFSRGLYELQHQRRSLDYWHQTAEVLTMKMDGISSRLDNLTNSIDLDVVVEQKLLAADFAVCQDRLASLERFCSGISGQNNDRLIGELHSGQERFLKQLDSLKESFAAKIPTGMNGTAEPTVTIRKRPAMLVKPLEDTMEMDQTDVRRVDQLLQDELGAKKRSRTGLRRLWRLIKATWPIQLCFLVLVVIGAYSLQPGGCENQNNWRNAWGPQLDHVRGPPPS